MILKQRGRRGARTRAALIALASLAALTTATGGQQAAAKDGETFKSEDASNFVLHPREIPGLDRGETARGVIEGAEAKGAVTRVSPLTVAQSRQHVGRALCHTTGINGTFKYNGFCWDETDDKTSAWSDAGGWHPQGFTASHDADASGTVDGHHLYMASWYYGAGGKRNLKARVSILESTGKDWSYGHVLLVRPTGSRANPGFTTVGNIQPDGFGDEHADGMVWYGNRLFVADGGDLQIYDLNHLWKVKSVGGATGINGTDSSASYHQWALPMIAHYSTRTKAQQDSGNPSNWACDGRIACLSSLSLDRSATPPRLVSGAYRSNDDDRPADVIRWPLDQIGEGGTADVHATSAYNAPVKQLQGVVTDGTHYYMAAQCDPGYMGDQDTADRGSLSCIWQAEPNQPVSVLTRSPGYTQNLSFAHNSDRLWGMNELDGSRVVFSLLPREADRAVYLSNDYSALCAGVGNKITNGSPVIQWGCNLAQDERWLFENTTDSTGARAYFLRNTWSGKCMGPASSLADGARMIQYTCNGAVDEKWWYDTATHELRNVYSGKCLGLGSTAAKGSQLIQWACNGAADEKWSQTAR
ncbi:RICIN domain-containing protein [Streptomyces griseochromogenes]|uniref:RICIN domain-containing protein n=1 Tax=Streptomyces griseochromogenes TaxID=68214 RepID=UPI0037A91B22